MISFDRDTAILASIVVCIAVSFYLYRELQKTKNDFMGVRKMNTQIIDSIKQLKTPEMVEPTKPKEPEEPVVEEKEN
jgi:hypothetical protein